MAEELPIAGGPETAKIRHIIGVPVLGFVTFGIYFFVWWFKINRELADLGRKHDPPDLGTSPGTSLLAVTLGALIIVPAIMSLIGTFKRLKLAQQLVGVPPQQQANGAIYGLLYFFLGPVFMGYAQNELNKVWQLQAGQPLGGVPVPGAAQFTKS